MADYDFGELAKPAKVGSTSNPLNDSGKSYDFGDLAKPVVATKSNAIESRRPFIEAADLARQEVAKGEGWKFNPAVALGEGAANLATGIGSSVVGGWRALASLATGGSIEDAANAARQTQGDYTYQPRTAGGKLVAATAALPIEIPKAALTEAGGDIGQAINGRQGRIAGESIAPALVDIGATLAGGRAAANFKGRSPVNEPTAPQPTPVNYDTPTSLQGREPLAQPEQVVATPEPIVPVSQAPAFDVPLSQASELDLAMRNQQVAPEAQPTYAPQTSSGYEALSKSLSEGDASAGIGSELDALRAKNGIRAPTDFSPAKIAGATDDIDAAMQSIGKPQQSPIVEQPKTVQPTTQIPEQAAPAPAIEAPKVALEVAPQVERTLVTEIGEYKLPSDEMARREQVLNDVGMKSIRNSAIEGNGLRSATEYGMGKFDEPAGHAAKEQFQHEVDTLSSHIKNNIPGTKGVLGLDEASLENKGQRIAAPFDAAKDYFEAAKKNLYDEANRRAGEIPLKSTENIDGLLKDPEFNNTAMADDQLGLVNAIQKQFDLYKERNAKGGLTVENAEQFRKWLNQRWKPDNRSIIADVKNALDNDVFANAGEDVFQAARQMHQLEKNTLGSKSIAKLMDSDPYDPVHRSTSYTKIADAITKMSPAEFKNLLDVMKNFPPELQASVQNAIDTIKGHYGDRLIKAGTETRGGNERPVWGTAEVNNLLNNNSSKLSTLFDDPTEIKALNDLRDAGNIVSTNPAYPGAAAQTANALKQGLMSRVIGKSGTLIGGGAGAMAGPVGAGLGAFIGDALTSRLSGALGDRKALEQFKKGIIDKSKDETK